MLRYLLPFVLAGTCAAATITIDQTTTYLFTNPLWATPESAPGAYGDSYTADLAEVAWGTSSLSYAVSDLNGNNYGAGASELTLSGNVLVTADLPFTPGQEFYFTIADAQPGAPVSLDLNEAFFGYTPLDPEIGPLSVDSPEPATWPLLAALLVALAIAKFIPRRYD